MDEIISFAILCAEDKDALEIVERRRLESSSHLQCEGLFLCSHCHVLLVRHYMLRGCGHALCGPCHQMLHQSGELCPKCREPITQEVEQSLQLERELYSLLVFCPNSANGCSHRSRVLDLLEHTIKCRFSIKRILPKLRASNQVQELLYRVDHLTHKLGLLESRGLSSNQTTSGSCEQFENDGLSELVKHQLLEKDVQIRKLKNDLIERTNQISKDVINNNKKQSNQLDEWIIRSREQFVEIKESIKRSESEKKMQISQEISERDDHLRKELSNWEKNITDNNLAVMHEMKSHLSHDEQDRNKEFIKWRLEAKKKLSEMVEQVRIEGRLCLESINEDLDKWVKKTSSKISSREIRLAEEWNETAAQAHKEMTDWWDRLTRELTKAKSHLEHTFNEKITALQLSWSENEDDRKYQFQKWESRMRQQTESAVASIQQRFDEVNSLSKIKMLENNFETKWQEISARTEKEISDWTSLMSQSLTKQRQSLEEDHNIRENLYQQDWNEKEADRIHELHKWESRLRQETDLGLRDIRERCDELESSNVIGFIELKNYIVDCVDKIEESVQHDIEHIEDQISQYSSEQSNDISAFKKEISGRFADEVKEMRTMFTEMSSVKNNQIQRAINQTDDHIEKENHIEQSNSSLKVSSQRINNIECTCSSTSSTFELEWRIPNFKTKMERGRIGRGKTYFSPNMTLSGTNKISWAMKFEKSGVSVFFEIINESDEQLCYDFYPKCTLIILDRMDHEEKINLIITKELLVGTCKSWLTNTYDVGKFSYNQLNRMFKSKYVHNDCLLIRLIVEPQEQPIGVVVFDNNVVQWTIDNFTNNLIEIENEHLHALTSVPFCNDTFKMYIKWKSRSNFLEFHLEFCGDFDRLTPRQSSYRITFLILDQSDREDKHNVTMYHDHCFDVEFQECLLGLFHASLFDNTVNDEENQEIAAMYMKNDTVIIEVKLEQLKAETVTTETTKSSEDVFRWHLNEYEKTKTDFLNDVINFYENESFIGNPPGYRLKAYAQWLANAFVVGLFFLPGDIDDNMSIPKALKITFAIIDQEEPIREHLIKTIALNAQMIVKKADNELLDWPYLGCHEVRYLLTDFEKYPFLKNDEIIIEITVEPD